MLGPILQVVVFVANAPRVYYIVIGARVRKDQILRVSPHHSKTINQPANEDIGLCKVVPFLGRTQLRLHQC